MSSCKHNKELINQKLDNVLNEAELAELEEHLNLCTSCNAYYQNMIELHQRLLSLPIIGQQESIVDQLIIDIDQIKKETENKRSKKFNKYLFNRYGLVAAAALLLFVPVAFYANQNMTEDLAKNKEFFAAEAPDGKNVSINNLETQATQDSIDSLGITPIVPDSIDIDRNYSGQQGVEAFEAYRIEVINNQLIIYKNEEEIYKSNPWEDNLIVKFNQINQNEIFYSLYSEDNQIIASYIINLESKEEKIVEQSHFGGNWVYY